MWLVLVLAECKGPGCCAVPRPREWRRNAFSKITCGACRRVFQINPLWMHLLLLRIVKLTGVEATEPPPLVVAALSFAESISPAMLTRLLPRSPPLFDKRALPISWDYG